MISTKGRYAIRVMIDLAEHDQGQYIPLRDIAERQEIYDPKDRLKGAGIRIVYRSAKDVQYQNILGLNVLTIRI